MTGAAQNANRSRRDTRALALLGAAVLLAALCALAGYEPRVLSADAVATVGGETIRTDDFERVLAMLAEDKRTPIEDDDRAAVLERMIEERLLVQAGIERRLVQSDPEVRSRLRQTLLTSIFAEVDIAAPPDETLRKYYETHTQEYGSDFESARPDIVAAHRALQQHRVLQDYLQRLRANADVRRTGSGELDR